MVRNLFQLCSFSASNNEHNSGGKIIQISDHKHKAEHKKQKQSGGRAHSDSLARNIKSQHNSRTAHSNGHRSLHKSHKKQKRKTSIHSVFYYIFAILGILFGIYVLFGGVLRLFK